MQSQTRELREGRISLRSQANRGGQTPRPVGQRLRACACHCTWSPAEPRPRLPTLPLAPLQSVLQATARVIFSICKSDQVTPHLSPSMNPHCSWNQHKNLNVDNKAKWPALHTLHSDLVPPRAKPFNSPFPLPGMLPPSSLSNSLPFFPPVGQTSCPRPTEHPTLPSAAQMWSIFIWIWELPSVVSQSLNKIISSLRTQTIVFFSLCIPRT